MKRHLPFKNETTLVFLAVLFVFIQACAKASNSSDSTGASASKTELGFQDPDDGFTDPDEDEGVEEPGSEENNGGVEPQEPGSEENNGDEEPQEPGPIAEEPGDDHPDDIIDDVIEDNPACSQLASSSSILNMNGNDYSFNGAQVNVAVENARDVSVNGATQNLFVNGARSVRVNGSHAAICLKASHFSLNGSYGRSGVPIVLVGEGANAKVDSVNGGRKSDLVLINIQNIGTLNGNNNDIYVYGGQVQTINGNAKDIHLMNGTKVKLINGKFNNIFLYPGSVVEKWNGSLHFVQK